MPVSIESQETHEKTWKVSWEFEADLRPESKACVESDVLDIGFLGDWTLVVKHLNDTELQLRLEWTKSLIGSVNDGGMKYTTQLDALVGPSRDAKLILQGSGWDSGAWPMYMAGWLCMLGVSDTALRSAASKLPLDLTAHRLWRLTLELKASSTAIAVAPRVMLPASFVASLHAPSNPGHVRLYFPKTDLELWTTQQILINASPYFATLFASGFAESVGTGSKRRRTEGGAPTGTAEVASELEFEDSDDEADEIYLKDKVPAANPGEMEYREVRITSATYSTYAALLQWLSSNEVDFAPLGAQYRSQRLRDPAEDLRKDDLTSFHKTHPLRAIPSSPKSLFRLTHFLEIPKLNSLTLASYKSMLTEECVALELVAETSAVHDEMRGAAVEVAVKHWKEVSKGAAMKEVLKMVTDGDEATRASHGLAMAELVKKGAIE